MYLILTYTLCCVGPFHVKVNDLKSFYKHIGPIAVCSELGNEFSGLLIDECTIGHTNVSQFKLI